MGMNVNVFGIQGSFFKIIFLCLHAVTCRQQTERVSLKMEMKKDTEEKGHTGGDGWSLPLACNPWPKWIVGVAQAWSSNQYVAACVDVQLCFVPRKGENTLPDTVDIQGASDHLGMIGDRGYSMVIPRSPLAPTIRNTNQKVKFLQPWWKFGFQSSNNGLYAYFIFFPSRTFHTLLFWVHNFNCPGFV